MRHKYILVLIAFSFTQIAFSQKDKSYKKSKVILNNMFNKQLFIKADAIVYLTDSVGDFCKKPTHITITNYQQTPCYFKNIGDEEDQ